MKKALVLLVSACILNACTEDEFYTNKKATNSEQSFYEFAAFNDSLKNTPHRAENIYTRGWWDNLKRAIAVAGADFAGACAGVTATADAAAALTGATLGAAAPEAAVVMAIGGVLCGASASIIADSELPKRASIYDAPSTVAFAETATTEVYLNITATAPINYIKLDFPQEYNYMNLIGGMHNSLIEKVDDNTPHTIVPCRLLQDTETSTFPTDGSTPAVPTAPYESKIPMETGTLTESVSYTSEERYKSLEAGILQSCTYSKASNELLTNIENACTNEGFDNEKFFASLNTLPIKNEKIIHDYYAQILNSYAQSMEDILFIANEYIKKIDLSINLDKKEKESLFLMIAVSVNSIYYWNEKYEKNK